MRKIREEVDKIKEIMGVMVEARPKKIKMDKRTTKAPKKFPIHPKTMMKMINSYFPECSGSNFPCLGKINNENCITELGIIGGEFSEKNLGLSDSGWSVLNRFDTNGSVHSKIWEIYQQTLEDISFSEWIEKNFQEIINGKYTKELVDLNSRSIKSGYINETYAIEVIKELYGDKVESITNHCAGDYRDRKLGQDLDVIINGQSYYYQIKNFTNDIPLTDQIKKYSDVRGPFYEIVSYNHSDKYKEEDVDVMMYVNSSKKLYILFANDYNHIATLSIPGVFSNKLPKFYIRYYEEPIATNISIQEITKQERKRKEMLTPEKKSQIDFYKGRISFFQDLINKMEKDSD